MKLKLTLKRKWFDMIKSGEKKEEYREIKPYWFVRLVFQFEKVFKYCTGYDWHDNFYRNEGVDHICKNKSSMIGFIPVDEVQFFNGAYFSESLPNFNIECTGIRIGTGREEWGAEKGKNYFVIELNHFKELI